MLYLSKATIATPVFKLCELDIAENGHAYGSYFINNTHLKLHRFICN